MSVAPARERGFKLIGGRYSACNSSRSREGAWIEINFHHIQADQTVCRSREGAWIEIPSENNLQTDNTDVAPARERGLK